MLLGVDVGGTFTDAVLLAADGAIHTAKVPSTPADQSIGVIDAIEAVLRRANVPAAEVQRFGHGMTVATNALLEGEVAETALLATEGFTDLVELGRQARPELYRLCTPPAQPLSPPRLRFSVRERTGPDGPLLALSDGAAADVVARVRGAAPQAVAVVLLHSYAHPQHERMLGELLNSALPGVHVSLSHDLVGTFREYERAATTELDAALSPLLRGYLLSLRERSRAVGAPDPQVMQSSGGLIDAERAADHAALTVLSGPAGGVGGAQLLARLAGERSLLCLDMGGTSCDVCLIADGRVAETAERVLAGRPIALPALDIHTVGAGGGSIAWRDPGGALRVGPRSAGAEPGPACYGRGGAAPTVTDANLLLGRLSADQPLAGGVALDVDAAERAVRALAAEIGLDTIATAEGILRVAEAEMVRALQVISVQRGVDPRGLALMAFGGAGPLHAAALAAGMGMRRILCPRASGVLCALGLSAAAPRHDLARTVMLSEDDLMSAPALSRLRQEMAAQALARLDRGDGQASPARPQPTPRWVAEMRYRGQSFELAVDVGDDDGPAELRESFEREHEQRYGYRERDAEIELVTLRCSVMGAAPQVRPAAQSSSAAPARELDCTVIWAGERVPARQLIGELAPGTLLQGPAVCCLPEATLFVPPGWSGEVDAQGTAVLDAAGSDE